MAEILDTVVIGGGQAGLALGWFLSRQGRDFLILEAADEAGASWRSRWESLTLFTPNRYCALPGTPFPGAPYRHAGKDDVADYLAHYADQHRLPVRYGAAVISCSRDDDGVFTLATEKETLRARRVVAATGPYQAPALPAAAERLTAPAVHSSRYTRPEALPGGHVLVVGAGNSGAQIAAELAADGRRVTLAGRPLPQVPQRLAGRDVYWWFDKLGMLRVRTDSRIGRKARTRETVVGTDLRQLVAAGVLDRREGKVTDCDGEAVRIEDGTVLRPDAVVWATGYRPDLPWLERLPVLDGHGAPVHQEGATRVPGLHFLGLPWQTHRASALLAGIGHDAALLARRFAAEGKRPSTGEKRSGVADKRSRAGGKQSSAEGGQL